MDNSLRGVQIIINGDDYGLSQGINRAIEELHHRGRLNSTSLLVNTPWSDDAVEFVQNMPGLRVGIHLNLSTGKPLNKPQDVSTIVRKNGNFFEMPAFLSRFLAGRIKIAEVELELNAQIEKALDSGILPQHLNSHMHFHAIPALAVLVNNLAKRYGILNMRNPDLSAFMMPSPGRDKLLLDAIYGTTGRILKRTQAALNKNNHLMQDAASQSDQLLYLRWFLRRGSDPAVLFQNCIDSLNGQTLEIIAHPAEEDELLSSFTKYVEGRQDEFSFLNGDTFGSIIEANNLKLL